LRLPPESVSEEFYGSQVGTKLWEGLHGYYCCSVTDLYIGNNGDLTPLGKSLLERVGV
jgi:hypothetical protein